MIRRNELANFNHLNTKTVTSSYVVTDRDEVLLVDATAAAVTITLPDALANKNLTIYVKKVDSSGNAVTVATTNSQTIDGSSTASLSSQYATLAVVADGVNWQIKTVSASGTFTGGTITGATNVSVASATALVVGPNGTTNPTLTVDTSTASAATGFLVKSAAAAGGIAISAISSGTNESVKFDAKGSGTITFNGTATGNVISQRVFITGGILTTVAGGQKFMQFGNNLVTIGMGSGAPTYTAPKGSFYMRTDGSTTNDRAFINTDGSTTWTALTTAA